MTCSPLANPNDTSSTLSTSPQSQTPQDLINLLHSISHQIIAINIKCHLGRSVTIVLQIVGDQIRMLKCQFYAQCELPLTGKIVRDCETPELAFYSPLSDVRVRLEFVRASRRVCHESDDDHSESLTGSDEEIARGYQEVCKSVVHVFGEVQSKEGARWKSQQKFSALSVSASHMQPLLKEFSKNSNEERRKLSKKTRRFFRNGLSSKL